MSPTRMPGQPASLWALTDRRSSSAIMSGYPQLRLRDSRMTCQVSPVIGISTAPATQPLEYSPITLAGCAEGSNFRANSCLAAILGSAGCSSGGSGLGVTVPLSCASAEPEQMPEANAIRSGIRTGLAFIGSLGSAAYRYRQVGEP